MKINTIGEEGNLMGKFFWRRKRGGFSLVEILIAVALGGIVLTGMLMTLTAYLKLDSQTTSPEALAKKDEQVITARLVLNEISQAVRDLSVLKACDKMTFKEINLKSISKDPNTDQIPAGVTEREQISSTFSDKENVAFYWQSKNKLPFVENYHGGIMEYFLKYTPYDGEKKGVLALFYRSLKPGDKPRPATGGTGTGKYWNDELKHVILLKNCAGINYGYTEILSSDKKITFYGTPKFSDGSNPDLPEMIQILIADN